MSTWTFFYQYPCPGIIWTDNLMEGLMDNKVKKYYYKYKTVDY